MVLSVRVPPLCLSVLFTLLLAVDVGQATEIVYHDLEARIDPLQRSITMTDVLTVARERHPTPELFGFFLNRHLKLSEVSVIGGKLPLTIEAIPSRDALRDYFPAVDATQTPSYAIATYYRLIPTGQGHLADGPLRLRLVYRGVIDDPSTPRASLHTRHGVYTTGFIGLRGCI